MRKKIAVLGGGFYGSHIAITLAKAGHDVTILEKESAIFSGISGKFGVRLHAGPHYPRSKITREGCRDGLIEFLKIYPDLINKHKYSIYGLGKLDADGLPSKVDKAHFRKVCNETKANEVDLDKWGYKNLHLAMNVEEHSIVVGSRLRKAFEGYLQEAGVTVTYKYEVTKVLPKQDKVEIRPKHGTAKSFDHVVNTTSYQALLPGANPPFEMNIRYQPCLAMVYEDTKAKAEDKPFSFIVMDGWFPCIMPYDDRETKTPNSSSRKYLVTHGKWTIMGSHKTAHEAREQLSDVDEDFINEKIKPFCEKEMNRFWPEFATRFRYIGWIGDVIAKPKTEKEFRSAVTFQYKDPRITYVFPGKVSNIFNAADEVLALLDGKNVVTNDAYRYVRNGTLHSAYQEIKEEITTRNTCDLQTYDELHLQKKKSVQAVLNGAQIPRNGPTTKYPYAEALLTFSCAITLLICHLIRDPSKEDSTDFIMILAPFALLIGAIRLCRMLSQIFDNKTSGKIGIFATNNTNTKALDPTKEEGINSSLQL